MALDAFRIAARTLRKQPAFTSVVIISLALGIALNTTMYGMLDALIRPDIDLRDPGKLYWIRFYGDYKWHVGNRARDAALTTGMHTYTAITRTNLSFGTKLLEHGQTATEASIEGVAASYFDVLGVRTIAGRTFIPSDETADVTPVVIDEGLANRLFPKGESPVGASIIVGREPRVVVGVIPAKAHFPGERYNVWEIAPFVEHSMYIRLIRLRPGASPQDADRELGIIAQRIAAEAGEDPKSVAFRFHQAADPDFQFKKVHYAMILAVVAVLLVACANLANIQLARGLGRRRELAVRSALGASRRRLIVHLLTETMLLAAGGLLLGLVLTYWGAMALKTSIPSSVGQYIVEPQLNWRVLAFALGATTFCLIAVGVLPSILVSRTNPNDLIKSGAGTGATKGLRRRYAVLVAVEIALALALASLATVAFRTSLITNAMGFGYDPRPLSTGFISTTRANTLAQRYSTLLQDVTSRLRAIDGVADATATLGMGVERDAVSVEDAGGVREVPTPQGVITATSPEYARTYGRPIIKGRDFLDGESDHGEVIIDESTAKLLWPNANPVGALIKFGDKQSNRPYVRVVGVIGEREQFRPKSEIAAMLRNQRALGLVLYLPARTDSVVRSNSPGPMETSGFFVQFVARARSSPQKLPIALRREIESWGDYRQYGVTSMDNYLGLTQQRESSAFMAKLFVLFAALGVGLAAFGVYGVVAHAVAERRRELGVRVALGASARDILHDVLRESLVVALAGAALGLLLTKYGVVLLGDIAAFDVYNAPLFAGVAAVIVATAAASALGPALRATRIDPTESLRAE